MKPNQMAFLKYNLNPSLLALAFPEIQFGVVISAPDFNLSLLVRSVLTLDWV
jgi:hypothetical protein